MGFSSICRNSLLIIILYSVTSVFSQVSFIDHTISEDFDGTWCSRAVDMDGDGDPDILASALDGDRISWWENGGDLQFTEHLVDDRFDGPKGICGIDLDGDTDIDIVAAGFNSDTLAWWENDGDEAFSTRHTIMADWGQFSYVYPADVNGDTHMDLLITSCQSSKAAWLENDGSQQFTIHNLNLHWQGASCLYPADLDQDGDTDIVGTGPGSGRILWFENTDGQIFVEHIVMTSAGGPNAVCVEDMDFDGDLDLITSHCFAGQFAWFENDGTQTFTRHIIADDLPRARGVCVADLDLDGDIDIMGAARQANVLHWWENDGSQVFTEHAIAEDFQGATYPCAADFDNDLDLDIIVTGHVEDEVVLWVNTFYGANFQHDLTSGHAPLTIQFTDLSQGTDPLTSWAWDFESNGTIDTRTEHPQWNFTEPGTYTVTLDVSNGTDAYRYICRDCIHVFNGESALELNESTSRITVPATPALNLTESFTLEAWINPTGYGSFFNFGLGRVFDKEQFSLQLVDQYPSLSEHSLLLQLFHQDGTISYSNSTENSILLDRWQHIAVSYNGQDRVTMYVDGVEKAVACTTPPSGPVAVNSGEDLYVGNDISLGNPFAGCFDEVRIWTVVRSKEEIQDYMSAYLNGDEPGLAANWRMNEGNGEILFDQSQDGHDAIPANTVWVQGVSMGAPSMDDDGDGLLDDEDNCPEDFNPEQADMDGDGLGDECDNCAEVSNPEQADTDADGIGNICDDCTDSDDDGFGDPGYPANTCLEDNCPETPNPDQAPVESGDLNCQDGINVLDVLSLVNHILGTSPLSGGPMERADCNDDGAVNILDALGIINVILGIGECAPGFRPVVDSRVLGFCTSLKPYLSNTEYEEMILLVKSETHAPDQFVLYQNYPNPFNPTTTIQYTLPGERRTETGDRTTQLHTTLRIFNILGQEVRTLVYGMKAPGFYTMIWDGKNDRGEVIHSGIYFSQLKYGEFTQIRRMLLLK